VHKPLRFCSLGYVLPEHAALFDYNYGFLHGEAYVQALQQTDIFVYPSLYDGCPSPPLEALACGCATVTTMVGIVSQYAVDGENCLLCQPGDATELAQAVLRLLTDTALRERLYRSGPRTAEAFGIHRVTSQLLEFLVDLQQEQEYAGVRS